MKPAFEAKGRFVKTKANAYCSRARLVSICVNNSYFSFHKKALTNAKLDSRVNEPLGVTKFIITDMILVTLFCAT
jgi:hypothetical protein